MHSSSQKVRKSYSFIKVMMGHDLSVRRIPVMQMESQEPGPTLVLTACMHGDELGGTVVIQELFRRLKGTLRRGKVCALPLLNPFGFENTSRRISISNEDLNRSFPGSPRGTLAQRIADILMNKLLEWKPSLVLDLHNDWNRSIPYALIDPLKEPGRLDELEHYAKISSLPAIQEAEKITGSFSYSLNMNHIPALTLELGESLIINEKNVAFGMGAILSILADLEMVGDIPGIVRYQIPDAARGRILTYSSEPLCSTSGIIRFSRKPGEVVRRGDRLARVYNPFGKLTETITAIHDGLILGNNDYAVAYPGSQVMAFGLFN